MKMVRPIVLEFSCVESPARRSASFTKEQRRGLLTYDSALASLPIRFEQWLKAAIASSSPTVARAVADFDRLPLSRARVDGRTPDRVSGFPRLPAHFVHRRDSRHTRDRMRIN